MRAPSARSLSSAATMPLATRAPMALRLRWSSRVITPTGPTTCVRTAAPARSAGPGRPGCPPVRRGLLALRTAFPAGQGHVGPDQRVLPCAEDGVHQPERLDPLLAGQGAGHLVPKHLLQDVECPPGLGNIQAGPEAVGRHLPGRRDDRLRMAIVHALDDEPEQMPHVTATLCRAGCLFVPRPARFEHGYRLVDHPILGAGQEC